ncbi:MAG: response regulator transcription factor [Alphaproteobacteria bacterium]|jgi:DNA-binding response OmpR family regulator|nr:response regulator transcription factor [Alphaproteobacteria bacterium]MBT7942095.1 response regulator transcription factor [Alphaproteobacteria bacterium]
MRILLIEDHERFAGFVKESLAKEGFTVDVVNTGAAGQDAVSSVKYDAVVLDLGLPDVDGLDLLKSWRDKGDETPVLILSARDGTEAKVLGLNSGGDDYLLKPFDMEELVARIRALLRRPGEVLGLVITAGNVSFDTTAREVLVNGKAVSMPRREMGVLEHLMRRVGRVVPKDVLEDKIYGFGKEVSSNSVEVHVSRLRKRLGEIGADINVKTVRGVGYLLSDDNSSDSQ